MAFEWWRNTKDDKGEDKIELPKVIQDQLDEAKGLKVKVEELNTKLTALDGIGETLRRIEEQNKPKPAPKPAKTAEDEQAEREEISALLLTDPEAAYARLSARTNAGVMQLAAVNARKEVFDENPEKFEYYTGDVKIEVNKILAQQPLAAQANPGLIENTYYTVVGRMQKDINEGKIKSRFATASTSRGSGTQDVDNDRKHLTGNEDTQKIAKLLDIPHDEYIKLLEKDVEAYI